MKNPHSKTSAIMIDASVLVLNLAESMRANTTKREHVERERESIWLPLKKTDFAIFLVRHPISSIDTIPSPNHNKTKIESILCVHIRSVQVSLKVCSSFDSFKFKEISKFTRHEWNLHWTHSNQTKHKTRNFQTVCYPYQSIYYTPIFVVHSIWK